MGKIKGGNLMLFLNGKSIAFATSHTLSISGDTQDTSNKDEGGGLWGANEVSTYTWTVSTENMYADSGLSDNSSTYSDLFKLIGKEPVEAVFAVKSETDNTIPATGGWTPKVPKYTGKLVLTSLELNAPNGEYATFSAEFQGVGELREVTA